MTGFEPATARSTIKKYVAYRAAQGRCEASYYHLIAIWLPLLERGPVTAEAIRAHADELAGTRGWSETTRTTAINVLSGFFKWAVMCGLLHTNPCRLVPRVTGRALRNDGRYVLSKKALNCILGVLRYCPEVRDLVLFGAATGLRFSAIVNLRPADCQRDEDGDLFVDTPDKNGSEHRAYLFGTASNLVQGKHSHYLFPGPRGGLMRYKFMVSRLQPACIACNVPYGRGRYQFTYHGLRRACASHLLNSGESIERVMSALGWLDYRSAERYARLNDASRKRSFRKAGRLVE